MREKDRAREIRRKARKNGAKRVQSSRRSTDRDDLKGALARPKPNRGALQQHLYERYDTFVLYASEHSGTAIAALSTYESAIERPR